jgi:hypothetical protein
MDKSLITAGHQTQSPNDTTNAGKIRPQHESNDDNNKTVKRRFSAETTTKSH